MDRKLKAAADLFVGIAGRGDNKDLVIRVTTFDDAFNAILDAFNKKGTSEITNQEKFREYVNGYLQGEYKDRKDIIDALYETTKNEYERLQS